MTRKKVRPVSRAILHIAAALPLSSQLRLTSSPATPVSAPDVCIEAREITVASRAMEATTAGRGGIRAGACAGEGWGAGAGLGWGCVGSGAGG